MTEIIEFIEKRAGLFTALAGIVGIIVTIVGCLWRLRRKKTEYAAIIQDLQERFGKMTHEAATYQGQATHRAAELDNQGGVLNSLRQELDATRTSHQAKVAELTEKMEALSEQAQSSDETLKREKALVDRMMKLEGELWAARARAGRPRFRPLQDRNAAVISVLNLKGGVGKTTVTAHLAAALVDKGYKVLLIDLDLQGTLSSFFINYSDIAQNFKEQRLLQHFLNSTARERRANLLSYVQPILEDSGCGIVPTSDKLAYAEMNLTMTWLLKLGRKDTRFLLRKALHQKRITGRYDVILIDCPPLINTCCVNALAASDYVLIPVTPSPKVTERVPLLLRTVKNLRAHINPELKVAGVVMNRTYSADGLTSQEQAMWNRLLDQCQDELGEPLHGFKTVIPYRVDIRKAEGDAGEFVAPARGSDLHRTFRKLAQELENRLPADCRRSATAENRP